MERSLKNKNKCKDLVNESPAPGSVILNKNNNNNDNDYRNNQNINPNENKGIIRPKKVILKKISNQLGMKESTTIILYQKKI